MTVKESALDTAKTLEALLCALREYSNDPAAPREHINLLLSLAYELVDPIICGIDSEMEAMKAAKTLAAD
ncbi:MAG: hypothetical protein IJQ81_07260 [Oscillibacter sp.]|nr:hypothetical protein [Oscillibacter sp.]